MMPFALMAALIPILLWAVPALADNADGTILPKGSAIIFVHVIPALLALRKIWTHKDEGRLWQTIWSLIAIGVPFFGPLLFFGLGAMSLSDRGAGANRLPEVNEMIANLRNPLPPNSAPTLAECRAQAEAGDAKAQTRLGTMYEYGDGVPQDFAEAMIWYRRAANQGFAPAQNLLGEMYAKGAGVAESAEEACFWFTLAALGDATFIPRRDQHAADLSTAQIDAVRKRVRTWTPAEPAFEGKGVGAG